MQWGHLNLTKTPKIQITMYVMQTALKNGSIQHTNNVHVHKMQLY